MLMSRRGKAQTSLGDANVDPRAGEFSGHPHVESAGWLLFGRA